jgi:hypothetical protein
VALRWSGKGPGGWWAHSTSQRDGGGGSASRARDCHPFPGTHWFTRPVQQLSGPQPASPPGQNCHTWQLSEAQHADAQSKAVGAGCWDKPLHRMLERSFGKVAFDRLVQTSGMRRNFQLKSREYTVRSAAAGAAQNARAAMRKMIWIIMLK